jgi:hypothetical protein
MAVVLSNINNKIKKPVVYARREAGYYKNAALCLLERATAIPAQPCLAFL